MHKPLRLTSQVPIMICAFSCNSPPAASVGMETTHTSKGNCDEVMERFNDSAQQRRGLPRTCSGTAPNRTRARIQHVASQVLEDTRREQHLGTEPARQRYGAATTTKNTIHVTHPPQCATMTRPWSPSASELLGNASPDCATCHGCKREAKRQASASANSEQREGLEPNGYGSV